VKTAVAFMEAWRLPLMILSTEESPVSAIREDVLPTTKNTWITKTSGFPSAISAFSVAKLQTGNWNAQGIEIYEVCKTT
jgi:hypothetical protein